MIIKKVIFWILAVVITLSTAVYQRVTGPTYPKKFSIDVSGKLHDYSLPRSTNGTSDFEVKIDMPYPEVSGYLVYKRYKVEESLDTIPLLRDGNELKGKLPGQPPAGKLQYKAVLMSNEQVLSQDNFVIIRFKDNVPAFVLIPHILFIFAAMLLSNLAGLFAAGKIPSYNFYTGLTLLFFIIGGMVMGPVVQKYAFGEFWTGFPFGKDLTDNKALIATVLWIIAWAGNRKKTRRYLVIIAAVVNLTIGLIPHSARGSELDYSSGEIKTGAVK